MPDCWDPLYWGLAFTVVVLSGWTWLALEWLA